MTELTSLMFQFASYNSRFVLKFTSKIEKVSYFTLTPIKASYFLTTKPLFLFPDFILCPVSLSSSKYSFNAIFINFKAYFSNLLLDLLLIFYLLEWNDGMGFGL